MIDRTEGVHTRYNIKHDAAELKRLGQKTKSKTSITPTLLLSFIKPFTFGNQGSF